MKTLVISPTYNERKNITALVESVEALPLRKALDEIYSLS